MQHITKNAGIGDATQRFIRRAMSRVPAHGGAGLAQKLFSNRVKPSDDRVFSRVNFVNAARDLVFGSPIDVARELRAYGRTPNGFNTGQALKRFYYRSIVPAASKNTPGWTRALNAGITGLNLGLPAAELYGAWKASPEDRPEAVGRATASIAAAPFTMRLGIPGMFLDSALADVGGAIGRKFGPTPQVNPPATT
jgi:hypothetical protein